MERSDWPTGGKLQDLRERGLVPYSSFASACLVVVALAICAYFTPTILNKAGALWLEEFRRGTFYATTEFTVSAKPYMRSLLSVFLVPAVVVLTVYLLSVALQTRFLLRPGVLGPDLSRLNPFTASSRPSLWERFVGLMLNVILGLCAGLGAVYVLAISIIALLNHNEAYLLMAGSRSLSALVPVLILVFLVLCVFGVVTEQLLFRNRHRMTREEREKEARE